MQVRSHHYQSCLIVSMASWLQLQKYFSNWLSAGDGYRQLYRVERSLHTIVALITV